MKAAFFIFRIWFYLSLVILLFAILTAPAIEITSTWIFETMLILAVAIAIAMVDVEKLEVRDE